MDTWSYILAAGIFMFIVIVVLIYIIMSSRRREVEAVEVERPRRGKREMVPFDKDIETALYKKRTVCPECSSEVDPYDEECYNCHARLKIGEYECPNCSSLVDPRDRECPQCGEILLVEPYVCPNCLSAVEADAVRCDSCRARFWSPIRLDEKTQKSRLKKLENGSREPDHTERPSRRRTDG
ncbi:MAG: zinc ribbon domain-containing protein [Candidatus Thermoplasmatota archaeon]|nr:zinc ribbon domain-containing protein [Candidatus Thermoplasmatota archaeon]